MFCLPAHTTHKLQPLDVSFFKPLSTFYNQAADTWLRRNPDCNITQSRVPEILGHSYGKTATIQNAVNGFGKTGICPFDPFVFQDSDFVQTALQSLLEERVEKQESEEISKEATGSSYPTVSSSTSLQNSNTSLSNLDTNSTLPTTEHNTSKHKVSVAEKMCIRDRCT